MLTVCLSGGWDTYCVSSTVILLSSLALLTLLESLGIRNQMMMILCLQGKPER